MAREQTYAKGWAQVVEGCLSLPGFGAPVVRPIWVEVQDRAMKSRAV